MCAESWKPIFGYEGLYEVSDAGRVRSLERRVQRKNGKSMFVKERVLKPYNKLGGYSSVFLSDQGVQVSYMIHTLVAVAFLGARPVGMDICHKNGDRHDNRLCNLRFDTRANNHADKKLHGTAGYGEKNSYAKLSKNDVAKIRKMTKNMTQREVAKIFGITQSNVSCIVLRKSWA